MILAKLAVAALIASAAIGPDTDPNGSPANLSMQQKNAAVGPLVRSATDCIAKTVAADPRFRKQDLGDLIVDSISSCVEPVRAMIDAYDHYFGEGTGEAFFMGPYLDVLPKVVIKSATQPD
ncbi:MAG TPA: hypothetical protein VH684_26320 [Xanthobacteraceae bacterium]|jgi:hypothetical protein